MRYIAYSTISGPMIGVVSGGHVQDLMGLDEFYADPLTHKNVEPHGAPLPLHEVAQIPPIPSTAKIFCIGLNYPMHIEETKSERPPAPNLFARWYSQLSVHEGQCRVPSSEAGLDWEAELAAIIASPMLATPKEEAMAGVLGYTCFNDVSARSFQRRTSQWAVGKNADGSGPIGPSVVTADEYGSPYGRDIQCRYNGDTVQSSTTDQMIFGIAETIEYITDAITLSPGDVIATGTPSGVGSRMDPPVLMQAGDTVEVEIEGIGVLRSHIV